jgi:hypothetical protein
MAPPAEYTISAGESLHTKKDGGSVIIPLRRHYNILIFSACYWLYGFISFIG